MPKRAGPKNRTPRNSGAEYRFKIDAYSPATMPMARLAEYMSELAKILGEPFAVHFERLEPGSTILVHKVDREAAPKVRERVKAVRRHDGPPDALRAYKTVNKLLREDDGVGSLEEKNAVIIRFPGREEVQETYPPIRQYGTIEGVIVGIVGADKSVHVRLMIEDRQVSGCWTYRAVAKELAHLLYEPVRLFGRGSWTRDSDGNWVLAGFKIEGFEPLKVTDLTEALEHIRSIPLHLDTRAYEELGIIRHGPPSKPNGGD